MPEPGVPAVAKPVRIQLRRVRGWRMTPGTIIVDRRTKWGNPFEVREAVHPDYPRCWYVGRRDAKGLLHQLTRYQQERAPVVESAIAMFEAHLRNGELEVTVEDVQRELRGKNLACWCPLPEPGQPDICHAAVLLGVANG